MKRLLALIVAVLILVPVIWITFKRPPSEPIPNPRTTEKLRVGIIPITDGAQVFVAQEQGYFRDVGIEVEIIPMKGGAAALPALSSGSIDVAFTNTTSAVLFEKNIGSLTSLAGGVVMDSNHSESGLLVRSNSGINKLTAIRNKKIGINVGRNILELAVRRTLQKAGVPPGSYEFVEIPFPQMEPALRSGRVDAVAAPEPFLSTMLSHGGVRNLGDVYVLGFGKVFAVGYFTTPNNFSQNRKVFQRYNEAIARATAVANSYSPAVLSAISKHTGVKVDVLQTAGHPLFVQTAPPSAMEQMKQWMTKEGFL